MELPALGGVIDGVTTALPLFDYGYRAAWKVTGRGGSYLVKADERPGLAAREREAHAHARRGGVPVQQHVASLEGPPPAIVFRWLEDVVPLTEHSNRQSAIAAGAVMREVHQLPALRPGGGPWADLVERWFEDELAWMVGAAALSAAEGNSALGRARALRPVLNDTPLTWTHVDCQAAHFLIAPATDEVGALIDWADAQEGAPEVDFAVLSLFQPELLEPALTGYGASEEFRARIALTLPLYRAVRAAGAYRWLETHGYAGSRWPGAEVRAFIG